MTATWTTPRTWVAGELVTAALMNTHVRDNLDWLKTPIAATATWSSNWTTTSSTFADITGAAVTLTTNGGGVDLFINFDVGSSGAATTYFQITIDGVAYAFIATIVWPGANIAPLGIAWHIPASSLSAASHTIRIQARCSAGTTTVYGSSGLASPQLYAVERGA